MFNLLALVFLGLARLVFFLRLLACLTLVWFGSLVACFAFVCFAVLCLLALLCFACLVCFACQVCFAAQRYAMLDLVGFTWPSLAFVRYAWFGLAGSIAGMLSILNRKNLKIYRKGNLPPQELKLSMIF